MAKKKPVKKKKPKRPKKYNLKSRITSALRRIWFYGPTRREAVKLAKLDGNRCAICRVYSDRLQVDHIEPCVPLHGKPITWDEFIERLMVPAETGLRSICKECHSAHTCVQKKLRDTNKAIDKASK